LCAGSGATRNLSSLLANAMLLAVKTSSQLLAQPWSSRCQCTNR
jgi:hypothetical protein